MARVRGALLPVAHHPDPAAVGAEAGQVLAHRFRPALAEGQVVLGRAPLVRVAGDGGGRIAPLPQALAIRVERAARLGGERGVVESEVDRVELAGGLGGRAAVLHAGPSRAAVGVHVARVGGGAAAGQALAPGAAILLRGGLRALGHALVLRAFLPLRAILVLLALRPGLAGVAHADGTGLLRALGIVAALAADPVDAHLGVSAAILVVPALWVGGRLGTAEEQDQGQGSDPSHVRALTTAPGTVKEAHPGRIAAGAARSDWALSPSARGREEG